MAVEKFEVEITYDKELSDRDKQKIASNINSLLIEASNDKNKEPLLPLTGDYKVSNITVK